MAKDRLAPENIRVIARLVPPFRPGRGRCGTRRSSPTVRSNQRQYTMVFMDTPDLAPEASIFLLHIVEVVKKHPSAQKKQTLKSSTITHESKTTPHLHIS